MIKVIRTGYNVLMRRIGAGGLFHVRRSSLFHWGTDSTRVARQTNLMVKAATSATAFVHAFDSLYRSRLIHYTSANGGVSVSESINF